LHAKPHVLCAHVAVANAGASHVLPHAPQSFTLLEVSTHVDPQRVGAAPGQPLLHAKLPDPSGLHAGVAPLHDSLQLPQ
jgi:hypothetical protein